MIAGVVHYAGMGGLSALFRSEVAQDMSLFCIEYPGVFTYDKVTKQLELTKELLLPKSSLVLGEEVQKEDNAFERLVGLELGIYKINSFLKEHFKNGKRALKVLVFVNEKRA